MESLYKLLLVIVIEEYGVEHGQEEEKIRSLRGSNPIYALRNFA
jgi:hypothetical protein